MPDLLDRLLEEVERHHKSAHVAVIKSGDQFRTVPRSAVDEDYGSLELLSDATENKAAVYEQKVTAEEKAAQEKRSESYGIGVKESGSATIPKKWKDAKLDFTDFGDPVNCKFPLHDEEHVRNAIARWNNDDIRKQYTADEQDVVAKRILAAASKFDIEVDTEKFGKSDKSADIVIAGETFRRTEEKDGLGRSTYRFEYGDLGEHPETLGFIHANSVAQLALPKGTSDTEKRRLLGILTQEQKTARPTRQKGDTVDDLKEALDNAIESAGTSALSSCWWAFLSVATDYWDGGFSDGIEDGDFPQMVSALSDALNSTYEKFKEAGKDSEFAVAMLDARKHMRAVIKGETVDKAGARFSKRDREKVEGAIADLQALLDGDKKDDKQTVPAGGTKSADRSSHTNSEVLKALQDHQAEVERLKARDTDRERTMEELRTKLAERDVLLDRLGHEPLEDPMQKPGSPAPPDGKTGDPAPERKTVSMAGGTSIYDFMSPK